MKRGRGFHGQTFPETKNLANLSAAPNAENRRCCLMRYFKPLLFGVLALCVTGLWGCGQQKSGIVTAKIHELESRYAKLEEDFRTLQVANEQTRKRLSAVECSERPWKMRRQI